MAAPAMPSHLIDLIIKLIRVLECPVCYEYVSSPIHQCNSGHILCDGCKKNINSCPTCRAPMSQTFRARSLEAISDSMLFPCKNDGCHELLGLAELRRHESRCSLANAYGGTIDINVKITTLQNNLLLHIEKHFSPFFITQTSEHNLNQSTQTENLHSISALNLKGPMGCKKMKPRSRPNQTSPGPVSELLLDILSHMKEGLSLNSASEKPDLNSFCNLNMRNAAVCPSLSLQEQVKTTGSQTDVSPNVSKINSSIFEEALRTILPGILPSAPDLSSSILEKLEKSFNGLNSTADKDDRKEVQCLDDCANQDPSTSENTSSADNIISSDIHKNSDSSDFCGAASPAENDHKSCTSTSALRKCLKEGTGKKNFAHLKPCKSGLNKSLLQTIDGGNGSMTGSLSIQSPHLLRELLNSKYKEETAQAHH